MTPHEKLNRAVHFLNSLSPHNLWTPHTWQNEKVEERELSPQAIRAVDQIIEASFGIEMEEDETIRKE